MADNVGIQTGSGATVASDEISGAHHQRIKIQYGTDGSATDVSDSNPLPIDDAGGSLTVDGTVTANLSATDNAVLDQLELNTSYGDSVGGGTEAAALRVTIASNSTGVLSVDDNGTTLSVDDGAGSLTVDQGVHDSLNVNANIQVGDADVTTSNPVPVIFSAGNVLYYKVAGTTIGAGAIAYAANDLIGSKITIANFVGPVASNYLGVLRKITLMCYACTTISDIDVVFFDADPSATTFTDNAAFAVDGGDVEKQIFGIRFLSTDFTSDSSGTKVATKEFNLIIKGSTSKVIYVALIAQGALDFVGANSLAAVFVSEPG